MSLFGETQFQMVINEGPDSLRYHVSRLLKYPHDLEPTNTTARQLPDHRVDKSAGKYALGCDLAEDRKNLFLVEPDTFFLLRPNLVDVNVVEARFGVILDFLQVRCRIRTTNNLLRDVVLLDEFCCRFQLGGQRKFHFHRSRYGS